MKTIKIELDEYDAARLANILRTLKKSNGFQFWDETYQIVLDFLLDKLEKY